MSHPEFLDLATYGEDALARQCDVCVIGAGAAGIYLAVELVARGLDVILLEAGNNKTVPASAIGFDVRFEADLYPGATEGRSFCLGGSTSRWGGLLIPHTLHDLRRSNEGEFDPWRHIVQTVSDKAVSVLNKLGWSNGNDFSGFAVKHLGERVDALNMAGLDVTAGLFLPFSKRNLVWLLGRKLGSLSRLRIFYNAAVNGWWAMPGLAGALIQRVQAVSSNRKRLTVTAQRFVIAAGAIESTRLLLELNQSSHRAVIRNSSATGCYLADHLSVPIADVALDSIGATIRLFAPRFSEGWMRSFRFLEADPPTDAPRAFAHFIFENKNSGFALAKKMLGAIQERRRPSISSKELISGISGLVKLGYKRFGQSALYMPPDTKAHLQLDIEQVPLRENGIKLGDEMDRYGRRIAQIHWRIGERDLVNLRIIAERILKKFAGVKSPLLQLLPRLDDCTSAKPHDAYHPVGTCRLGRDSEAVVDENLKVWGLENLWVVSTGVLPSAGTANPTFTMLCLADRLAEQIADNRRTLS